MSFLSAKHEVSHQKIIIFRTRGSADMRAQTIAARGIDANSYTNFGNQRIAASGRATYCLYVVQMAIRVWRLD